MVVYVMPYKIVASGATDKGLVRQNNEDVWAEDPEFRFFVLADGMGGHRAGEIASRQATDTLIRLVRKGLRSAKQALNLNEIVVLIRNAIIQVNDTIFKLGNSRTDLHGMGTTLCCMLFHEKGLVYGHVGDSRIYGLFGKKLHRMTKDHSLMRELVDLGQLTEVETPDFLYKNILTRAIGTEAEVEPSVYISDVAEGDIYFMCSDGLTDLLSDDEIENIINQSQSIPDTVKALVESAKSQGGYDNITVVMAQVQENHEKTDISR